MALAYTHLSLLIVLALPLAAPAVAQERGANPTEHPGNEAPTRLIDSLEGRDLFRAYCAACHGADARGGGPAAASLKTEPPDLTRIAQRRGGMFSRAEVEKIIAGEAGEGSSAETHGMREMPIWGPILGQIQRDQSLGKVRIRNLANYLESLQQGR